MRIHSKLNINNAGIPVLSFKSGNQLITEVTAQTAIASTINSQSYRDYNLRFRSKSKTKENKLYQFCGEQLVQSTMHTKGLILNTVA